MSGDELPLIDQLAEEFLDRLRRGEKPTVQELVDRHPELEDELRELLPTLAFMEEFKPRESDRQESPSEGVVEPETAPQQIGDYRILKEIGRGGMGIVFEAEQLSLGRHVALKLLPLRSATDAVAIARFQQEARAAAQLQHPNIVPIIDIGTEGEVNYFAMQYIHGQSLADVQDQVRNLRAKTRVPDLAGSAFASDVDRVDPTGMGGRQYWRSIARVGVQVARALAYAHDRGVVHRDIKPANLLLDQNGVVWVTDFGLAKTADTDLTGTGDLVGTLRFMSPERFRGRCDASADIFSLGATLYELLVLQPAFHSLDRLQLIERITREDPLPPRLVDPGVPVDLETIVLKALEKEPRRRYASAAAFAEDLERFLSHQPIHARRTSALGKVWRWAARNRALATSMVALGALLVAVAISAVVVAVHMRGLARESERARTTTARQLYRSQLQNAADAIEDGRVGLARSLLLEAPERFRGWEWGYLKAQLDRSVESPFPAERSISRVQFASDGRLALLGERTGTGLFHFSVVADGGQILLDLRSRGERREAKLFADDDTLLLYGPGLEGWSVREKRLLFRRERDEKTVIDAAEYGYLIAHPTEVHAHDLATGEVRAQATGGVWWGMLTPDRRRVIVAFERRLSPLDPVSLRELPGGIDLPDSGYILDGDIAPSGRRLAVATGAGTVLVFGLEDGHLTRQRRLTGYIGNPTEVVFSRDSRYVALATAQGRIYVWDAATGALEHQFIGHTGVITSLAVDPRDGALISCGADGSHRAWSFDANSVEELRGHASFVYPVAVSPDGETIVSGGWDGFRGRPGALRLWDTTTGAAITAHLPADRIVTAAAYTRDGRHILAAQRFADVAVGVSVLDAVTGREQRIFQGHGKDVVVRLVMHPDGQRALSVGQWESAHLWDIASGQVERSWQVRTNGNEGSACAISPDGAWIALARNQFEVDLIEVRTGAVRRSWRAHEEAILDLAFSPDGRWLLSASADDSLGVWSYEGELVARLRGHGVDALCVAATPCGRRIASGGRDGSLLLWDSREFELVARFRRHRDYVYSMAWSPSGDSLVTGSGDHTLRVWSDQPLGVRLRERRRRAASVRRLRPRVRALLARAKDANTVARQLRGDASLSDREKVTAYQILQSCFGQGR